MKVIKKGLLGRSLFDFYGDVKTNALRVKESPSVPQTPIDQDGGVVYVKTADGKLYYKSNEVAEVELSAHTGLSTEEVQDIAGALVATGGTKTGIAVTYQDATGDVDFVVDHDAATNYVAAEHVDWAASGAGTIHTDNYIENVVQTTVSGSSGTVTSIGNLTGDVTSSNRATTIADDAVTYAKMQNVSATNVVLGRDSAGAGVVEEISAANLRTIINVEDGATADQTQADINGLAITTVGTIGTGVWQGTTIKTAYIGDDQITEDKLADTLLAEIDANTAKATNVSTNLTYTTGSDRITIVSSDGTNVVISEASGSIAGVMTVAHHDKLDGIEDSATADQTKSDIDALGIAATTAVSLTTGNKTINGNLIVTAGTSGDATLTLKADTDNSNEADNPYVAFEQDGAGVTAQIGFSGGNNEYPDASTCTGAITNALIIGATGTGAARKVQIATQNTARVTVLDTGLVGIGTNAPAYELDVTGDLSVSGNVLPGITTIKILPSDFIADDGGRPLAIDDTSSDRWLESHSANPMFASVEIPPGFKATLIDIFGSATSAVTVYEADVNSATVTSKGTGNIGTQINITDVTADATNYIMIEIAQASGEKVYGGVMTIAKA